MTTAIRIENLSKRYIIGHQRSERYPTLRDVLMHKLRGFGQRFRHPLSVNAENTELEEFWALQDINLEISEGDCVGVIGRNGAGKSTLLKILSRITEPTTGLIKMRGRVASLLEVGTGFHPELSGRENIYLNGAILGMSRQEIKRKFDEIIAFAEVEKFLDTPVKRYSSGMYVRLAFAVAAHLEPEILIVDEVLAVGDTEFQKKCLGKIGEVAEGGRTVLFVSHNLGAVDQLTSRCALIDNGRVACFDKTAKTIQQYKKSIFDRSRRSSSQSTDLPWFKLEGFSLAESRSYAYRSPIEFRLSFLTERKCDDKLSVILWILNGMGLRIATAKLDVPTVPCGRSHLSIRLEEVSLPPGEYQISLKLFFGGKRFYFAEAVELVEINSTDVDDPWLLKVSNNAGTILPCSYQIGTEA